MSEELKPCPFCGGDHVELATAIGAHYAQCNECNAFGPDGKDTHNAVEQWNTRSDLALAAQGALLEKAANIVKPPPYHDEDQPESWQLVDDVLDSRHYEIRALSPDATAALAELIAKERNDALREARDSISGEVFAMPNGTSMDRSYNRAVKDCLGVLQALMTTEETNE